MKLNEMKRVFKTMCDTNNKILVKGEKIVPLIMMFKGDDTKIDVFYYDKSDPSIHLTKLREIIYSNKFDGYLLILDGYIDKTFKKSGVSIGSNCAIRTLYTPEYKEISMVAYSGNEIVGEDNIIGRVGTEDIFDCWGKNNV